MQGRIKNCCAVSVHVRRGDYLTTAYHRELFAACWPSYYAKAFETLASKLKQSPVFFVFSDELEWVKENITFPGEAVFVNINDDLTSSEDMRLMSSCQHHIIANSTFSWWGAWLNPDPKKIVVAPRYWFANQQEIRSPLLLPEFVLVENGPQEN